MRNSLRIRSHKLQKNKSSKKSKSFKSKLRRKIQKSLIKDLGWRKGVADTVASFICSLLSYGKVWQKELARDNQSNNKRDSDIRKAQRFFRSYYLDYRLFSIMIFNMFKPQEKVTVLIDRTNWDHGKKHINILVAAMLWSHAQISQKSAIPITWEVFDKKGNSNTQERKNLILRLIDIVGKGNIKEILGDREFIGGDWIKFLHDNGIAFVLRIKKNMYIKLKDKLVKAEDLVSTVKHKERLTFNVELDGIPVQLVATRSIENDLVIVVASMDVVNPLSEYRLRWLIELFFKSIKSKGFHIEETNMSDPEKIKKLFALIALATAYTVQAGVLKHCLVEKMPVKNHKRAVYSLFTYGLDFIHDLFDGRHIGTVFSLFSSDAPSLLGESSQLPPEDNICFLTLGVS